MRRRIAILAAALTVGAFAQGVPVIFDTDMGNDVDDALALAMLHALESRGECRLLAVTVTKDNPWSPVYVDLVNTFRLSRPDGPLHTPAPTLGRPPPSSSLFARRNT